MSHKKLNSEIGGGWVETSKSFCHVDYYCNGRRKWKNKITVKKLNNYYILNS
jgi:hypothetical protein